MSDDVLDIYVHADGTVQAVYSDELADVLASDDTTTRRASHVEPCGQGWVADMQPVGGPVLSAADGRPFPSRRAALAAETAWLRLKLEQGRLTVQEGAR